MNAILAIPLGLRLLLLAALGACLGAAINQAVIRLSWTPRSFGPWHPPGDKAPARRASDRLPLWGWLGLRREAKLHGRGYWVRPFLVESLSALAVPGLYYWEVVSLRMIPGLLANPPAGFAPAANLLFALHAQFAAQVLLGCLMAAAALIDADEKIVPDGITLPGTILGLAAAAIYPWSLLVGDAVFAPPGPPAIDFLRLTSTSANWLPWLDGRPHLGSLALGLGCYALWCFALLPRPWRARRGYARALALLWARVRRERFSRLVGLVWTGGSLAIGGVWMLAGDSWRGLLTALVGLVGGAGIVWTVRLIAVAALKKEAMGFGDVTFLAMVGAFLGWQPALIAFFLAPLAAVFIGAAQWLLGRGNELPYVPYLALASAGVVVRWADVWDWGAPLFTLGWLIPGVLVVCLGLMAVLLWLMGLVTRR